MSVTVDDLKKRLDKCRRDAIVVLCYEATLNPEAQVEIDPGKEGVTQGTGKNAMKVFLWPENNPQTTKKKNYTMDAWVGGYSVGSREGFCRGKWAGYTQALAKVLELIPGGTLKDKIQALFDEALTTGKTT